MTRWITAVCCILVCCAVSSAREPSKDQSRQQLPADGEFRRLFDGRSFEGWEGDTEHTWRIEDEALTAGSLTVTVPRNEFLATTERFADFDLRLDYKVVGTEGFTNGGVQFRTERIPNHHEVIGYQADLGKGYDGALYDESRRRKILAQPDKDVLERALKPGDWNHYRIRAEGPRIQIWLNGIQTVDYTETDDDIPRTGVIAVQIHGNGKAIAQYRNIEISVIPSGPASDQP